MSNWFDFNIYAAAHTPEHNKFVQNKWMNSIDIYLVYHCVFACCIFYFIDVDVDVDVDVFLSILL